MKYLGAVKYEHGTFLTADNFSGLTEGNTYEAIEVGGSVLLVSPEIDRQRMERLQKFLEISIAEHRKTLEGLA